MRVILISVGLGVLCSLPASAADFPRFQAQEIDPHAGEVCYAVTTADVNGDGKPDIVVATESAVIWYENPGWRKQDIVRGATARDNVCIQPHDIDGDGRVDFALGAGWRPTDTKGASTLQWLGRDGQGQWKVHPIAFEEPTLHRLRFGDVKGTGRAQLVVVPLQGRGTKGPDWGQGQGVRVLVHDIPVRRKIGRGPSKQPTRRCIRSTISSSSIWTATPAMRSSRLRGKACLCWTAMPRGTGTRSRSERATRKQVRSKERAK